MDKTSNMDALMTIALKEIIREDWNAVTSASDDSPLSPKFNRRMERMISSGGSKKQNHGRLKHIGIGILVALAVFAMLGMAIPPVREAVIRTVFTWYDTHFGVRYEVETDEPIPTVIEEVILPAWLPDGWTVVEYFANIGLAEQILSGEHGEEIVLTQYPFKPDKENVWFDNTDVEIETIRINKRTEAQLFSYADGSRILTWVDRYVFILSWVSETADADMLIRIAESMDQSKGD